jgi:hypothetical protein
MKTLGISADIAPQSRIRWIRLDGHGLAAATVAPDGDPSLSSHRDSQESVRSFPTKSANLATTSRSIAHNQVDLIPEATRMSTLALRPYLVGFREQLSRSWSAETAYHGTFTYFPWIAGDPRGQCGVSSVWLADELAREYSIRSTFCVGALTFDDDQVEDLPHHCWLEIRAESEDLVLDLTCDQAQGFDQEILFDSKSDLDRAHIYYSSRSRVNISDLPNDPVWPRYQKLLLNIAT